MNDTIFARATAAGRAAVAIIRISGPGARAALEAVAGRVPESRRAVVRRLRSLSGEVIDQALVLWMPSPASFTGEDCAELQVHGGRAVLEELSTALRAVGLRQAEAGEFSRRALVNGRMDLLQAEAIADLVDAETSAQKRQALAQMSGGVGRRYDSWRRRLIEALALLEAENDFPDEDLPGALAARARPILAGVREELEAGLATAIRGRQVREGYRIALVGRPNAGKSSLFNALLGRDAAIVSSTAGTTRDVVQAELTIAGYAVTLADTAGLRDSDDEIEAEGVRRARAWAETAGCRLLLVERGDAAALAELVTAAQPGDLLVISKADLMSADGDAAEAQQWADDRGLELVRASVTAPDGLAALRVRLEAEVVRRLDLSEVPLATRERHQQAVLEAISGLARADLVLTAAPEQAAEDIRLAAKALASVVGQVDHEAVLDRVFGSFCIGK